MNKQRIVLFITGVVMALGSLVAAMFVDIETLSSSNNTVTMILILLFCVLPCTGVLVCATVVLSALQKKEGG